jgi:hypothetical protein
LAESDGEWVISDQRRGAQIYIDVDDDTIPEGYPTKHYGESFYAAMLGANIKFVGTEYHTCSGAEPLILSEADLEKLHGYENNPWVKRFGESVSYFASETNGDFWLKYLITIDALNLAVELLGTTEAYVAVSEDEGLLRKVMEFGVGFNLWFYELQKGIYAESNKKALGGELYDLYDKTWYSVDAYDICRPDTYERMGFEYHQELINKVGGGMMHTHGTGLLGLLPYIARLKGLGKLQIGRDLYHGDALGLEHLPYIRKITGDIPLQIQVSEREFTDGIKNRSLPGGVEYITWTKTIGEANRLAYIAKEYKAPNIN